MNENEVISYSPYRKNTKFQISTDSTLEKMIPEGKTTAVEIHFVPAIF